MFWGLLFFLTLPAVQTSLRLVSTELSVRPPVFAHTNNETTPWLMRSQALQRGLIMSEGSKLRKAIEEEVPLQVVGTINAYCARLAERAGFKALYLSGAGAANASFGLPDLGITTLNDVCEDVRRITATTKVPLLVAADTGWGSAFNIARTVREFIRAGAAGCHLTEFGKTPLFTVEELKE